MNLSDYRHSAPEKARVNDLLSLIPGEGRSALDIGARDGFISRLLAEHFPKVTALDLDKPVIDHPQVECVKGNITALQFGDSSFDMVLCAEVLEHIPPHLLQIACGELARVTKEYLIIGVPYQQDIRVGRTTCRSCGNVNPPWGHVNSFDEKQLKQLFSGCAVVKTSFVGQTDVSTNALSCALMDLAGNPY